ncbi:hypothetical protein BUALT_Bualt18G0089800 [Buddleja alternifolia]|uniref:Major facilitator superfamily (MFS) profile domain-containing protein n=1 Tax=Buddleja alternifolia TaxID=168488 RepID=A0AAV6WBK2_9LAMI|nr:hypothetical protein BUALT_Bualt18G0089800 [Buddleja alternifolia]
MTDPNPLLPHSNPATPPAPELEAQAHHRSLDDAIEHFIGDFRWTHLLQSTILSFAWFFDAQQTFITVFTDAQPKWSCKNSTLNYDNDSFSCNNNSNICNLSKDSWNWNSPSQTSIISEWSLECASPIITGLPASSFFAGCFVGGFVLATLADSNLGRKNLLVLASLIMSISGFFTAFSTNIWIYAAFRFISGFGRCTVGTSALVLSTELVGKKWRGNVGILGFILFTFGFLSLPAIAFLLEGCSWRLIYLYISIPSLFYSILVYFSVHESPRWLFVKGKKQEFVETLRKLASPEKRNSLLEAEISFFSDFGEKLGQNGFYSALKILLQKDWAWRRLSAAMAAAFGLGMMYYGMPLSLGNLSFDLYLSVTLNALSEFPASILAFVLIGKLNRKGSVLGLGLVSGICSLICVMVRNNRGMKIAMEMLSFSSACTAVDLLLIYTLELFPTSVRNSAVGMVRQALVVAGVISPVLVAAGRRNEWFSYGVFGVTISVCALFVVCLPETKGRKLCDTMEEEERDL